MRPARKFRQRIIGFYARQFRANRTTNTVEYVPVYITTAWNFKSSVRVTHNVVVDGDWFLLINRETREYKKFKTLDALHTAVEFGALDD